MIEAQALVTRKQGNRIYIRSLQSSACQQCQQQASCSTTLYSNVLPNREVMLTSSLELKVGDKVMVGVAESHLLYASLFMYLVPLLVMLAIVGLSDYGEAKTALLAMATLCSTLWSMHKLQDKIRFGFMKPPEILRKT